MTVPIVRGRDWRALARDAHRQSAAGDIRAAQATARTAVAQWVAAGARRVAPNLRRNVVMLHGGRCGSTVLVDLLAQHFEVDWDGEIFTDGNIMPPDENPIAFLLQRVGDSQSSMYGIEIKSRQDAILDIDLGFLFDLLVQLDFRHIIYLRRRNLLRRLVSSDIAMATGQWHAGIRHDLRTRPVHVDVGPGPDGILHRLDNEARALKRIEQVLQGEPHLSLNYEDDVMADPLAAYVRIRDYLELPPLRRIEVRLRRTNPLPLTAMVANHAELAAALAGSRYEAMLHD